ncbi:hypothetical protein BQ8482_310074 [Mesorhizobium delmotii]|uniref:Amidohydrolase 3 domain-containing protein n=1 Tax=Mesorhizobium delmotii TaxID=1631247 RepID=A0A2P9ANM4_9HYPH|nr:hypothetical protein BQ8482_310074 [Mesorhizobium delmotii]
MPPSADLIVENASILTMDPDTPRAEAIAVKGGEIIAIADRATVLEHKGPGTRVIDAERGSVVPGFIEAHMHLFAGAAELDHLQLMGVHGFDALCDAVRNYAAKRPDLSVLQAQGADYTILSAAERVSRHHLDRILPDRPFVMAAPDHHTMWANTKALELAGLLRGKRLGPGNEIVMGDDGLASGELREGEAFGPLIALAGEERVRLGLATGGEPDPKPTPAEQTSDRAIMRRGLEWCARHGITSIQNMDGNLHQLELLSEIEAEGGLLCRVQVPFHYKNFMTLDMLDKASVMAERYNGEWLSSGMVKVFYDGVLDSWTAVMVEPYADRPDWLGEPLFTPQQFIDLAVAVDRRGLQIAVHSIGDGAVRAVLDGYEAAQKAKWQARRPASGRAYRGGHRRRRSAFREAWRHCLDAATASARQHGLAAGTNSVAHRARPLAAELCVADAEECRRARRLRLRLAGVADRSDPGHSGGNAAQTMGRQ